ncbi:MAG: ATP-binding protein, partial [Bacteroidales bacterium]|nr:ATP-binding protein [Bacteroidales bacterium]
MNGRYNINLSRVRGLTLFILVIIVGLFYIYFTWASFEKRKSQNVMQIARSVVAVFPVDKIDSLEINENDLENPVYINIKQKLTEVTRVNPEVRFSYLYALKDSKLFFIADSEPEDSEDYSPPGEEFVEADEQDFEPFLSGNELVTKPLTDRWGTWVSAFIPVKNLETGEVIAVFGMDFDAKSWRSELLGDVLKSGLLIFLFLLVLVFLIRMSGKNALLRSEIKLRKEVDEALYASETRMRSITDSAKDAIIMMDDKGLITYWNPAAEVIFGYSNDEALGKGLHSLIVPEKYHLAHYSAMPHFVETGEGAAVGKTLDLEAIDKNRRVFPIQISLSSILIDGRWNAIGILRDISEQKKSEEAIIKAREESERANKSKSIFLSNMSHEIRTPLNAIIGFSQLLGRESHLSIRQKEYIDSIIRAGEHLLELINEILELSKIEAGRVTISPSNIDLHALYHDIQMIFKERANYKNLRLIFENNDQLPHYVVVDEGKLRQLFVNIIGNAIKFTEEGGVAVRSRVDRVGEKSFLFVEVQDSGPGIDKNEFEKLFRHFEQTSSGIKKGSGTGLGLALSKELALMMGGDVTVTSELEVGSVFTFSIEVTEGKEEDVERKNSNRIKGIVDGDSKYRILVVDDKRENLMVAVNLLKLIGFITYEAVDGLDAIEKFKECKPHLILMDMRMPVMDGYESTRIIKSMEQGAKTPIVALTASTFEEERERIESLNMQGYVRKPFRENDLLLTMGKILGIEYIYEEEDNKSKDISLEKSTDINENLDNLSENTVSDIINAVSVADIDKLLSIISEIELY